MTVLTTLALAAPALAAEAQLNVTGKPFRGTNADGTVRGFVDAHLHIVADLRAGGHVIHGKAFDPRGIEFALGGDEQTHGPQGALDVTGNLLRSGGPAGTHDTQGWPSFTGWPAFDTNTHQQVYYRWLQRVHRAGLRVVVAQIVEDEPLCLIEPLKRHTCDETEVVKLGVARLRALEAYVDERAGGPGKGWLRLVRDPAQARRVVERGKLAVVIGVESSGLFGCYAPAGIPRCDKAGIERGIALYRSLGISSVFVAHWTDNALAGAAIEGGDKGLFIGTFQILESGAPFSLGACPEPGQGEQPEPAAVYGEGHRCNTKGLTALGEYAVERLMDNGFLIEVDHISERARLRVLELAERRGHPLVSSHTDTGGPWSESTLRRLFALGGFAAARPSTAAGTAATIARLRSFGTDAGVGLGTDTGGFATLPAPEPATYPFTLGDAAFERQRTGTRTFDLNRDGVAHYGLFADHLAAMAAKPGGEAALAALFRSAEGYLRTWASARAAVTGR